MGPKCNYYLENCVTLYYCFVTCCFCLYVIEEVF